MTTYKTFDSAYMSVLDDLYYHADFYNAPRGFKSREKLAFDFEIENPVQRGIYNTKRKCNIIFNFAEALWYLSGSNKLSDISYYNQRMTSYSMDKQTLTGTAYGSKIFHFGQGQLNQWENVKKILRKDPDSKRAVIQIFDANELAVADNLDVSCTLGLQFLIRHNKLQMITYMRANDAFRGMVSDVFSFTIIQELMATELNLAVGNYYHRVGTMHIYEPDNQWVTHVLKEKRYNQFVFPSMPKENNWLMIQKLMTYEKQLRQNQLTMSWQSIEQTGLSVYWQQVLALLSIYQMIYYHKIIDDVIVAHLLPIYRFFLHNKWPNIIKAGKL